MTVLPARLRRYAPRTTFGDIRTRGNPCGGRLVEQEDCAATGQATPLRRASGKRHGVGESDA
jgi:hypothetical protein